MIYAASMMLIGTHGLVLPTAPTTPNLPVVQQISPAGVAQSISGSNARSLLFPPSELPTTNLLAKVSDKYAKYFDNDDDIDLGAMLKKELGAATEVAPSPPSAPSPPMEMPSMPSFEAPKMPEIS